MENMWDELLALPLLPDTWSGQDETPKFTASYLLPALGSKPEGGRCVSNCILSIEWTTGPT